MKIADLKKDDIEKTISKLEGQKSDLDERIKYLNMEIDGCESSLKFWKSIFKNYSVNGKEKNNLREGRLK